MLTKSSLKQLNLILNLSRYSIVRSNVSFSGVKIDSQCDTESQTYKVNISIRISKFGIRF